MQTLSLIYIKDGQILEFQSINHCVNLCLNFIITTKTQFRVGAADHKTNPRSKGRMILYSNQNRTREREYISTKLLLTPDVLDKFKEMYHRFTDNTPNPTENI